MKMSWVISAEERFDIYAIRGDDPRECWLWMGVIKKTGYGEFKVSGRPVLVHRFSYERFVGPIPPGLVVDHLCRVRHCVNPEHLEVVTLGENVLRGEGTTAVNFRKTHCFRGHEFTVANTYVNTKGARVCRACQRVRARARTAKQREAAMASP